ncbi:hypothetical protein INT45_006345 [Circinella minor]|uniref:Uncharacterized protein n=1 Tax=Circinella minor TaxID=1195481 RepID=A0A8H7RS52_9FUNG|nr:hypothetical protein INT45_006345 [Circinella minor]
MKMVIEDHLEIANNLIKSDICHACMYQNLNDASSPLCVALDGNFSLRRLANVSDDSGDIILDPNYQSIKNYWIAEQFPVEPVRRTNTQQRPSCSSFKALSRQRKGNARGLDETGIFGSTCARYGFPLFFMSMRGGESNGMTFEDLKDIPMAVPVFYAYSHGAVCQSSYHPRLLLFGLTDAEWLERLWAATGSFSPQTKYSGPIKRKLMLTCAFNAFKDEKIENIGRVLKNKFSRANIVKNEAEKALENYSMDRLKELWEDFLSNRQAEIPSQDSNFNETKEALRNAVAKYDWTLEILRVQGLGHRRAQVYSQQAKNALKKVQIALAKYIAANSDVSETLTVQTVLGKNSSFRSECNIFHHPIYPFEQYHRYQRAVEELKMLKKEADSVVAFGREAVKLLENALAFLNEKTDANLQELGEKVYLREKLENIEVWLYDQCNQLSDVREINNATHMSVENDENIEHGIMNMIRDDNNDIEDDELLHLVNQTN